MISFRNIIQSGLSDTDLYQKKRGIVISNYISLILSFAFLLFFIIRRFYYGDMDNVVEGVRIHDLPLLVFFLMPVFLNRFYFTTLSQIMLCYLPVISLWYIFISQMKDLQVIESTIYDAARVFFLALSFIPFLLFDKSKKYMLVISILPTLISLLFLDQIMSLFGVGHEQRGITGNDYQLMPMRTIIAYLTISGGCFTFQSIIITNDILNQKILSELKKKTDEIKAQNDMLIRNKEKLNRLNQHLGILVENKTENIRQKNEKLIKYAYANAHQVRGPVARLLGLIQLSKMKTDLSYPWFFDKVEYETKAIDEIIRRISKDLNYGEAPIDEVPGEIISKTKNELS